ncbi:efflux RND transporter periplasmic adaptor subunit [Aeoliella sp. SH292]|uniref:efflux RND transporter periplasmic adaptor subunit n=1 Tax=Aeoliella sp. SH292 TaxID=3454464 RepID=UPI003F98518D
MKTFLILTAIVATAAGGALAWQQYGASTPQVHYRTTPVERGDLIVGVSATGTLQPEEVVDVGAQVVGRVKEFGLDPNTPESTSREKRIDYGSMVEEGTVLARIDDMVYVAQRNQAKAALARANADLIQLQARREQADAEWKRAQRLRELSVDSISPTAKARSGGPAIKIRGISDSDYVLAKSNFEVAVANVAVGEAAVAQAQSSLDLAETNLGFTIIKSPVKGTIIDRRVNIGQTVVSSLNAPSLFLIAKDLTRMQVWASVNEADIGVLKVGLPVSFTVDAFPDEVFRGAVEQVRLNASMTQNVVTYTVVVAVDNSNMRLLPYLTANVQFEVSKAADVLNISNAALRYQPSKNTMAPQNASRPQEEDNGATKPTGTVWVQQGETLKPIEVQLGTTDGARTEISAPELAEGMQIVEGELSVDEIADVKNPFGPPQFGRTRAR